MSIDVDGTCDIKEAKQLAEQHGWRVVNHFNSMDCSPPDLSTVTMVADCLSIEDEECL